MQYANIYIDLNLCDCCRMVTNFKQEYVCTGNLLLRSMEEKLASFYSILDSQQYI